jgi:hypothetical protein
VIYAVRSSKGKRIGIMAVRRMDCFAHKSCPDSCCWVTEGAQGITKYLGLARAIYIYIYGVYTVLLAGKSPNIRCIHTRFWPRSHKILEGLEDLKEL